MSKAEQATSNGNSGRARGKGKAKGLTEEDELKDMSKKAKQSASHLKALNGDWNESEGPESASEGDQI